MKTLRVFALVLIGACSRPSAPVPVSDYQKPFSELRKDKEAYVDAQVKEHGPSVLTDEAGAYREYMRWLRFWEPRLGANGSYASYNKNLRDYYDAQLKGDHSNKLQPSAPGNADNWKELGPFATPNHGIPTIGWGGQLGVGIIQSVTINRQNPNKLLGNSLAGGLFFRLTKVCTGLMPAPTRGSGLVVRQPRSHRTMRRPGMRDRTAADLITGIRLAPWVGSIGHSMPVCPGM